MWEEVLALGDAAMKLALTVVVVIHGCCTVGPAGRWVSVMLPLKSVLATRSELGRELIQSGLRVEDRPALPGGTAGVLGEG